MHLRENNKWNEHPRLLTDEEIADPMKVIHEVFDYAHLPDLRNTLWEWLKTTISGNFNKRSFHYKDRESLLAFYEKLQRLLEASHLLLVANQLRTNKQSSKQPPPVRVDTIVSVQMLASAIELAPLIDKLVSLLSPEFLFTMGKIQEHSFDLPFYYFLLVLPNTATCTYASCQEMVENTCPETGTIRLLTVKKNEWERQLKEGSLLYASLCTKERIVYAKDNHQIPSVNTVALPHLVAKTKSEMEGILGKAEAFYTGANFFLQQHNVALTVFHFQQTIEHCLRGFLLAVTGRSHVSHNLICLRRLALPFFPRLVQLLPIEKDTAVCPLYQVSKAYVQSRYENDFSMSATEIKRLKDWVEVLLPQTRVAFEQWVSSINPSYQL